MSINAGSLETKPDGVGGFAVRHAKGIYFIVLALSLAGIYALQGTGL